MICQACRQVVCHLDTGGIIWTVVGSGDSEDYSGVDRWCGVVYGLVDGDIG